MAETTPRLPPAERVFGCRKYRLTCDFAEVGPPRRWALSRSA